MAEEGRRGKVKEAEGKAKEGHTTQEVAPGAKGHFIGMGNNGYRRSAIFCDQMLPVSE